MEKWNCDKYSFIVKYTAAPQTQMSGKEIEK